MNEVCQKAQDFLTEVVTGLSFNLTVSAEWSNEGCLLNLQGADIPFLLTENGEMLDAFETLLFQIYGKHLERSERFVCDADGFRKTRRAELQAMARFAAQSVRKNGKPFTFGKLNSTERRIIHLALQEETDLITHSLGEGKDRRLGVSLK